MGPGPGGPSGCGVWGRGAAASGAAALRGPLRRATQTARARRPSARSTRTCPPPRRPPPLPGLAFAVHGGSESAPTRRRGRLFFSSSSCSESLPCHVTFVHSASGDARVRRRRKPRPLAGPPVTARRALAAQLSSEAPPSPCALPAPRAPPFGSAPPLPARLSPQGALCPHQLPRPPRGPRSL